MVTGAFAGKLFVTVKQLFNDYFRNGWTVIETKNGRMTAKYFDMLDGTPSCAGVAKDFVIIYGWDVEKADFLPLKPMHVLLKVSVETLAGFYSPAQAGEIYSAYRRFKRSL